MRKGGVWAIYDADVKTAWNVLVNREDVSWRSDLKSLAWRDKTQDYVEYSNDGYQLGFIIKEERPYEYYEIETWSLETKGTRSFEFEETEDGKARVILREQMKIKPMFIEWMSRLFMPLDKILTKHLEDARPFIEMGKEAALEQISEEEAKAAAPVVREHQLDDDMPSEEELAKYDTDYFADDGDKEDEEK